MRMINHQNKPAREVADFPSQPSINREQLPFWKISSIHETSYKTQSGGMRAEVNTLHCTGSQTK